MGRILVVTVATLLSFGIPGLEPTYAQADNAGLKVVPPRLHNQLDPNRTYLVKVNCTDRKGGPPLETAGGFWLHQNVAATHLLAITDSNTSAFPASDKAKAFIAVYAVSGDETNRTTYVNKACSTSFFLTARKPLFLLTNASKVAANTLGTGLKLAESGLALLSSAWPLFTGLPVPNNPGVRFNAVKNSSGPLDTFIGSFNQGATSTEPRPLYEGLYTIDTDYSHVTVRVTPLISIVGLKNKTFTAEYEDAMAQVFKGALSSSMTSDQVEGPCLAISNQMRDQQGISSLDISYGLLFLAVDAGLQKEQIIRCLGPRYASPALQFVQKGWDERQKFDDDTVATVFGTNTVTLAQPAFNRSTKSRLEDVMGAMRIYATIKGEPTDANKRDLSAFLAPMLNVDNKSDQLTLPATVVAAAGGTENKGAGEAADVHFKPVANWQLMDELKKNYTRFGCLFHDNDSLALFLAIPEAPKSPPGKYQITDVLVLRLWLNSKQQISQLQIAFDGADIAAAIKQNSNACGPNVIFIGTG